MILVVRERVNLRISRGRWADNNLYKYDSVSNKIQIAEVLNVIGV